MDTQQIVNKLCKYPNFIGVFARDKLPVRTKRPAGLVINTDKLASPGTHWVAYYIDENGVAEYFDPLGEAMPKNEISAFVKRNGPIYRFSNIPFQALDSSKCGAFCILYLRNRLNGLSMCQVHAMLSQNPNVNDAIV